MLHQIEFGFITNLLENELPTDWMGASDKVVKIKYKYVEFNHLNEAPGEQERPYLRGTGYLPQDLPEIYREHNQVSKEKLMITIPDEVNFSLIYEALREKIVGSINRIRKFDIDLELTIRSITQERDLEMLK